jgi:hypothetical protein
VKFVKHFDLVASYKSLGTFALDNLDLYFICKRTSKHCSSTSFFLSLFQCRMWTVSAWSDVNRILTTNFVS